MKRKLPIVILIVGVLLIVAGITFGFYKEFNDAKKEKQELEERIINDYKAFEKEIEKFNEVRSTYYTDVDDNLYQETVEDEYNDWIEVLDKYTESVDNVENTSVYLKEKCVGQNYSNQDIVNKCQSFIIAYETVMNYYTKNINDFNKVINEYLDDNEDNEEIKVYESKYNYTDIDDDGKFYGKD